MRPLMPALACGVLLFILLSPTASSATSTHTDIEVLPANVNKTIFQGGSFRRTCRYTGSRTVSELRIQHNGVVTDTETEDDSIMLDVDPAQLSHAGPYTCEVVFTDASSISASMGTLTVVDLNLITAPENQYVVEGEDITLECTFDNQNQVYGTVIITIRRGGQISPVINSATVDDEGEYSCDVSLINHYTSTQVPIALHVFTPINITNYPEKYQELFGVQEAMFTVSFTGRQSQGLVVSWFKNGIQLFDSDKRRIVTVFSEEERTGNTSIHFPQMKRDDGAVYRVLVKTEFGGTEIEDGPKRDDESFQVEVVVSPPDPANFQAAVVTEHQAQLQWVLSVTHPDEEASSFQLTVSFPNGSTAYSASLNGSARSAVANVFPGITYDVTLTARNEDGVGQSITTFSTPPAAPYVTLFEARRLNETHFNISISLLYTGGGDITTFSVYFREQHSIMWSSEPVMVISLDSALALEYHGVISGEEKLRGKGPLEFELRVKNSLGFMNRTGSGPEISDPPGRPTTIEVSDIADTSVRVDFKLPEEGTPPFINIVLEFSKPQVMERNFTGTYYPGQTVMKELRDLNPKTAYSLKARAVNYAGNGPSSDTIDFTTATSTPEESMMGSLMMPIIFGAAAGGGIIFIIVTASVCGCCCYCRWKKRQQGKKPAKGNPETNPESGDDPEKEKKRGDPHSERPPSSTASSISTLEKKPHHHAGGNIYLPVPQHDHRREGPSPTNTVSSGSQSPSMRKWKLDKGHNQASSSTLNSGSATQDSFIKKPDILSTDSEIMLHSPQTSHQIPRDGLRYYHRRQKGINPSISSGGSETTTETTERYQTTPFLQSSIYSSSQTIPFTPQGVSYTSLTAYSSDQTQTQYSSSEQPPQSQCTDV